MSYEQERRAAGMQRVPVQALVEICGRDIDGAPAFEAESVDVSGRGMHLRTAYLPEIGSTLVCRFESGTREIVVEGTVAWAAREERGGEFGIQFTALDSGSVEALRELCGIASPAAAPAEPGSEPEPSEVPAGAGKRVRLHIDGLGSPMKASVRGGGARGMQVASNLEFLKVGRHLEIEDVHQGERRGAQIDTVNVVIDPSTQVPQLVVALRFDGVEESTPEPSVIDSSQDEGASAAGTLGDEGFKESAASTDDHGGPLEEDDFVQDDVIEDAQAMRGKFASFAVNAGSAAKKGGAVMAKASAIAATGMGRFFQSAGAAVKGLKNKTGAAAPKRTTAPPPSGVLSAAGRRLRPQSGAAAQAEPTEPVMDPRAKKRRVKKIAAASALGVLLLTIGVLAMKKQSAPPGAEAAAKEVPASVEVAAKGDVNQVDEQGNPITAPSAANADPNTANVPLFGPTPMATMEPAPLGAAPTGEEGGEADPEAAPATDEAKEKAAASAAVEDQVFGESASDDEGKEEKKPGSAAPWGNGKLHEPVIHRLRLDKAGTEIQGAANATGFTVMLPGVKVMEATKGIEQRDPRIARVKTRNSTNGAEISFQFKDGIPGYKVRLKKDYVEFLVSSGKPEAKLASTTAPKKAAKKATKKSANAATKQSTSPKKGTKKGAKKTAKKTTKKKKG